MSDRMKVDLRHYRAVLLDVDGTLVDSNEGHARSWFHALEGAGIRVKMDDVRSCIGMGGDKLLPILAGVEKDTAWGRKLDQAKKELFTRDELPKVRALPGARELLFALCDAGIESRIVTSADRRECESILKVAGLDPGWVGGIISSSEAKSSKPDPVGIYKALDELKAQAAEAFFVGDTPYDIEASVSAGVDCIAFRTGYWGDQALSGARLTLEGPRELTEIIEELRPRRAA